MDHDIYASGSYWQENDSFHDEDAPVKVAAAAELLRCAGIAPKTLIDVGCGGGLATRLLAEATGATAVGIDVSPQAIEVARSRHGAVAHYEVARAADSTAPRDLGAMFDVFEHVEDYIGFLREARPAAHYWVFNIPLDMNASAVLRDAQIEWRETLGHLHSFSAASGVATLEHCGYEIVATAYRPAFRHFFRANPSVKRAVARLPREATWMISPALCGRLFGGVYFFVLARGRGEHD